MEIDYKFALGFITSLMVVYAYLPYLKGMRGGVTRPHTFTWIIWSLMSLIAVAGQLADGAGAGAWALIVATVLCLFITVWSFKVGDKETTKSDWVMFIVGLSAIPLWLVTSNPLWSVILVTMIEIIGCAPTIRKSWHKPHEEVAFTYALNTLRYVLSIAALENFTLTTSFYPFGMVFMNGGLWLLLLYRRRCR